MKFEKPIRQSFESRIQSTDQNTRTITCIIVSGKTNRGRRKIDIQGCQYEDYLKSPVVLAFHDDERVIARCQWLKFTDEGITARFEFRDSGLSKDIFDLYAGGYLTSWSIGFLPLSWNYEEEDGLEILHITKWTLLEVSAVSIPMDANAVTLAVGQGLIHDEYLSQSIQTSITRMQGLELFKDSVERLEELSLIRQDISTSIRQWTEAINEIRISFEGLKDRLGSIESMMAAEEENSIEIVDFSDFSKEVGQQLKTHIKKIKGVI